MMNEDRVCGGVNISVHHVDTTPTSVQIHTGAHCGERPEEKFRETGPQGKRISVPSTQTPTFIPRAETQGARRKHLRSSRQYSYEQTRLKSH